MTVYTGQGTVYRHIYHGGIVEIQDDPAGGSRIFLSGTDPTGNTGFLPGDMWFNTTTGHIFRLDS